MLERQLVLALAEGVKLAGGSWSGGGGGNRVKEAIKNVCLLHTVLYEFSAIPERSRLLVYFC